MLYHCTYDRTARVALVTAFDGDPHTYEVMEEHGVRLLAIKM